MYTYEQEISLCMCYTVTIKQKTQSLMNVRILLILGHVSKW